MERPDRCRCPECGRLHTARALTRRRIRYRALILAAAVVLAAWPAAVWQRMARHGPWAGAPTWALVMFAPLDTYCRSALGCPFSWSQMPDATRELMTPQWERPFAAWETAILKRRLEAGVERVREEFPGRDVAFVTVGGFTSEDWWQWDGPAFQPADRGRLLQRVRGAGWLFVDQPLDGINGLWHAGGLLILAADETSVRQWTEGIEVLRAFTARSRETTTLHESPGRVVMAFRIPESLVRRRDPVFEHSQARFTLESPWPSPMAELVRSVILSVEQTFRATSGRNSEVLPGAVVARLHPSARDLASALVPAVIDAFDEPGFVSDPIPVGRGTALVRVYNIAPLLAADLAPGSDERSRQVIGIMNRLTRVQSRPEHGGTPGGFVESGVGNLLLIAAPADRDAQTVAEFQRLLNEAGFTRP